MLFNCLITETVYHFMSQGQDTDITMADGRWMDGGWLRASEKWNYGATD